MTSQKHEHLKRLLMLLDICLMAIIYLMILHAYRGLLPTADTVDFYQHVMLLPVLVGATSIAMTYFGAYTSVRYRSPFAFSFLVVKAVAGALMLLAALLFVTKAEFASRVVVGTFSAMSVVLLVFIRVSFVKWYYRSASFRTENKHRVLVIGTGERAARLTEKLTAQTDWGVEVVGYLDPIPNKESSDKWGDSMFGSAEKIGEVLAENVVDEVILAVPRSLIDDLESIAEACEEQGVKLRIMGDIYDLKASKISLADLDGIPLISFEPVAQDGGKLIVKRFFDLVLTIGAMPILLPVFLIVAICIKLDDGGPVFFRQERVGMAKRRFKMWKFRTMCVDADEKIAEIEHLNEADGPIFKIANDPRVTKIGNFMRRTSIDELPQLFNVLAGQMSLVGPRPMSVRDVDLFDKGIQRKRFSVKPGLTCLWQVSGRSDLPFDKWLELDLDYIERWSLALDLQILLKTIPAVFRGSGAV
ncbi:MAG: sugar transferase [Pseudomonadota bacterium]